MNEAAAAGSRTTPLLVHTALLAVALLFGANTTVFPIGLRGLRDLLVSGASGPGWASIGYVVVGGTALPYLLNSWALARVDSSIVAVYVLLQPVIAASLARVLLHEQFGPHTALAAFLVVSGVGLSSWRRR